MSRRLPFWLLLAVGLAAPAAAGPPFDTDDPAPTPPGQWELYAGGTFDALGASRDGEYVFEANYGATPNLQLSVGLPYAFSRDRVEGRHAGRGDLELSVKYRFVSDDSRGLSVATFPAVTLPTGAARFTSNHAVITLPVWAQLDRKRWSLFGGGGVTFDPGPGQRNYAFAGIAGLYQASERLAIGAELTRQGSTAVDDRPSTGLGIGAIYQLKPPFALLARVGPTHEDGSHRLGFHGYAALGINF